MFQVGIFRGKFEWMEIFRGENLPGPLLNTIFVLTDINTNDM